MNRHRGDLNAAEATQPPREQIPRMIAETREKRDSLQKEWDLESRGIKDQISNLKKQVEDKARTLKNYNNIAKNPTSASEYKAKLQELSRNYTSTGGGQGSSEREGKLRKAEQDAVQAIKDIYKKKSSTLSGEINSLKQDIASKEQKLKISDKLRQLNIAKATLKTIESAESKRQAAIKKVQDIWKKELSNAGYAALDEKYNQELERNKQIVNHAFNPADYEEWRKLDSEQKANESSLKWLRRNQALREWLALTAATGGAGAIALNEYLKARKKKKEQEISPEEYAEYLKEEGLA